MSTPRQVMWELEEQAWLPSGEGERYTGYGIMGLPFSSGHVLALWRSPISSIGPASTTVWLRNPDGTWVLYTDTEPRLAGSRYFGAALADVRQTSISLRWLGPWSLVIEAPDEDLFWHVRLTQTSATRLLSRFASWLPGIVWKSTVALQALGAIGGRMLRSGNATLVGRAPNGQRFSSRPRSLWAVRGSIASMRGVDFGVPAPLIEQTRIGDVAVLQRGLLTVGQGAFESYDRELHLAATRHPLGDEPYGPISTDVAAA